MPAPVPSEFRPTDLAEDPAAGREPAGPRASLSPVRAGWRWLKARHERFEASRLADVIGAVVVFVLVYAVLFIAAVLG